MQVLRFRRRPGVILGLSGLIAMGLGAILNDQMELAKMLAVGIPPVLIKAFESEEKQKADPTEEK